MLIYGDDDEMVGVSVNIWGWWNGWFQVCYW